MLWYYWAGIAATSGFSTYTVVRRHFKNRKNPQWLEDREKVLEHRNADNTYIIEQEDNEAIDDANAATTDATKEQSLFRQKEHFMAENRNIARGLVSFLGKIDASHTKLIGDAMNNVKTLGHLIYLQNGLLLTVLEDEDKLEYVLTHMLRQEKRNLSRAWKVRRYERRVKKLEKHVEGRSWFAKIRRRKLERDQRKAEAQGFHDEHDALHATDSIESTIKEYLRVLKIQAHQVRNQIDYVKDIKKDPALFQKFKKASDKLDRFMNRESVLLHTMTKHLPQTIAALQSVGKDAKKSEKEERKLKGVFDGGKPLVPEPA